MSLIKIVRDRRGRIGLAAIVLAGAVAVTVGTVGGPASALTFSAGGWTTHASASPTPVLRGTSVAIKVTVTSTIARTALVDLEVSSPSGVVFTKVWDNQAFVAGKARTFTASWLTPATEVTGTHIGKVGIFGPGWGALQHWNAKAVSFVVTSTLPTTTTPTTTTPTTTVASTTTTVASTTTTVASTTTTVAPSRFATLPVGATLPSDAYCAAHVRSATEVRPANTTANHTTGMATSSSAGPLFARVTGSYVGTTDQILQWGACKWGLDEDIVRAQTAKESWWLQSAAGDWTTDSTRCAPGHTIGSDGVAGQCPESVGLLQVRFPYWPSAFPAAGVSSSYNVDYALASWRSCFEGQYTWLNQFERGQDYAAGDAWGCVGLWFAGRWHTAAADDYVAVVQGYLTQRIWTTPTFLG